MRIFIINPDYGMTREDMDSRCAMLQSYVSSGTMLHMECLTKTKVEIDSEADIVLAGPEILAMAEQAERDGYDAVVLYCFSDPAFAACRDRLHIPVVGGAGAACAVAPLLGRRAGVILTDESRIPEKIHFLHEAGLSPSFLGAVEAVTLSSPIWEDRLGALQKIIQQGMAMKKKQHIDVLLLGCLSFLGLAEPAEEALGIPVIDPAVSAVMLAEDMVCFPYKSGMKKCRNL